MKESEISNAQYVLELPSDLYTIIMKYLDLGFIMKKLMPLSKQIRDQVITQNYIIFKQFIRYFNLSQRMKRADIPAKNNIMQLVRDNIQVSQT
jgi:hypothetical protein